LVSALCFLTVLSAASASRASPQRFVQERFVQDGLAVDLTVEPVEAGRSAPREGDFARVRFAFTDAHTGAPLSGLFPAAWMDRLEGGGQEEPGACRQKVEGFVGGAFLSRPDLDLNTYYVLTLNDDATISVVDPLFGFGDSQLLAMVFLKAKGEDWALTPDGRRLFVSEPEAGRVAVVETASWTLALELETAPHPRRIALQPDGQAVWVAGDGGVTVLDPHRLRIVRQIATGPGAHDLAFSGDGRFAFLSNDGAGTVSIVDTAKLSVLREVKVGAGSSSLAWSEAAQAVWVASADGTLAEVRPESAKPAAVIHAEPGLGRLRFAPGGRLGFALDPGRNRVHVLDAASGRIVQTAATEANPDQVTFSDSLAYVRHRGSPTVLMIPLQVAGIEGRTVAPADFPGGQNPPGRGTESTPADGIVQAPGEGAVLVANPEDQAVYF
jgi:DNA-binding beta-propeller fold protein YncE